MINIKNFILPSNKNILVSLTYIYGIGFSRSKYICKSLNIDFFKKNKYLTDLDIKNISEKISDFKIGEFLKKDINNNINKLIDIKCYKGLRHKKKLPVRGQNTKNNARTRKGPKKTLFFKKKITNVKFKKKKK